MTADARFVRAHLAASLALVLSTAVGSYAYFHLDEYFQVLELARFKLGYVDAWSLPWEHAERLRPWLQPAIYVLIGKAMGASAKDPFALALACRLVTGLACWASLVAFVRAMLPRLEGEEARRLFVRVTTLAGFLPYLFVRTSSEAASLAALTAGVALLLPAEEERERTVLRMLSVGALFGVAFEARFQTAFAAAGAVAWAALVARASARSLAAIVAGGLAVVGLASLVDAWGYGEAAFPAFAYARTNLLEGAASLFGADPPFAYVWMSPANVLAPLVIVLLVLVPIAWWRHRRHLLTWTTLPFVLVHALLSHKEERFLFPVAVLACGMVVLAIAPGERPLRVAAFLWARRSGAVAKALAAYSLAGAALLAVVPLGWHHHVRFTRQVRPVFGDEMRVAALPDFDLGLPAFHPRVYDVEKLPAEELLRRIEAGTARAYLVADTPRLSTGNAALDARLRLVASELPLWEDPVWGPRILAWTEAYDARARPPLRPLRYRSLYRVEAAH